MRVNGTRLLVRDLGPRAGVPVVLLHGFPMDGTMWRPQVAALEGEFRVVCWDARGHGRSGGGGAAVAFEWFVDDLLAVLDRLEIDRAVLVGLSMGGYTALRFAEREPSRVRALVLADTKSGADGNDARVKRAAGARKALSEGSRAFADGFLATAFAPGADPKVVASSKKVIAAMDPKAIASALVALATRTDTTESLATIQVPTLVIVGEKDALTPPSDSRALAAAIPGARLVEIPGAGHFSNLQAPGPFNAALLGFLRG
jgi:pimeloyl-ACP methyl ester carboxylesterase